jgi:hypothetical protein
MRSPESYRAWGMFWALIYIGQALLVSVVHITKEPINLVSLISFGLLFFAAFFSMMRSDSTQTAHTPNTTTNTPILKSTHPRSAMMEFYEDK